MSESLSPSPTKVLQAQLLLKKASKAKKKTAKAAAASSKQKTATKNSETDKDEGSDKENNDRSTISWVKNPEYTSKLLSLIEESHQYRLAFGFKVPQDEKVSSSGQSAAKTSESTASALFPSSSIPLAKLGKAVVARIRAAYKESLGSTGHGLILEDRTQEIINGTPISNVWEKMQIRFPWYKRLHLLLSASPVYDGAGVANSVTPLDTTVLGPQKAAREPSPDWDIEAIDRSFEPKTTDNPSNTPEQGSPAPSDDADLFGAENSTPTPTLPTTPIPASTPASTSSSLASTRKRKDPFEDAKALTDNYLKVCVETEKIRAESKRRRIELTNDHALEIERMRATQQELQRQHELAMMDKQILLAQLESRNRNSQNNFTL